MDKIRTTSALALCVLASAIAAPAMAQETVQTRPHMTVEQMIAAQARQIEMQQMQIEALREQLQDVTATLSTRVDRVETQTESGRVNFTNPGPRLEGVNARNTMSFVGAVQATFGGVDQDLNPDGDATQSTAVMRGGTEIKRARIGIQGTAFNDYNYAVEVELAQAGNVSAAARDLWISYTGFRPFTFTVGNMKPLVGLETSFSDRSNAATFEEAATLSNLFIAPGTRYVGLRVTTGGAHWSSALGVYGDDVNNNNTTGAFEEGFGVHGRFTYAPIATAKDLLHFGVSGYTREVGSTRTVTSGVATTTPALQVRAQPENTIDATRLVDTGNLGFADTVQLVGVETAGFHGPVGFQAEWAQMDVDQLSGRPDLTFSGAYVAANWFLTGESRVYDPRTGVFTRFTPRTMMDPASDTWGAFELAARWSTLDLNSNENVFANSGPATLYGVRGGEETNYTFGVNWYWNAYFRLMLNYVHADVERRSNTTIGPGAMIDTEADLIALRVQQEW
jgi:phosphate-selective porin OprO/OprP